MPKLFRKILDQILYGGYQAKLDAAKDDIVARYSRGSITVQFKRFMMSDDADALHAAGNKAARRLARRVGRHGQ